MPASQEVPGLRASVSVRSAIERRFAANVLAIVPGADPVLRDEVVVIGAHLDALGEVPFRDAFYPGANDNASGTAVMLELARSVAQSPTRPKRTLLFAAWNGEEDWMVGSYAWVASPLFPLERTVAAFSIDMIGIGPLDVYTSTSEIADALERGRAALRLDPAWPAIWHGYDFPSDNLPFVGHGIPGVLFNTRGGRDTVHTIHDTPDTLSREDLERSAKLAWAAIRQYALGEEVPTSSAGASGLAASSAPAAAGPACLAK